MRSKKRKAVSIVLTILIIIGSVFSTDFLKSSAIEEEGVAYSDAAPNKAKVTFVFALVRTSPTFFTSFRALYLYGMEVEILGTDGHYTKIY